MKMDEEEKSAARVMLTGFAMQGILAGKAAHDIQVHYAKTNVGFAEAVADQAVAYANEAIRFLEMEDEPKAPALPAAPAPAPVAPKVARPARKTRRKKS